MRMFWSGNSAYGGGRSVHVSVIAFPKVCRIQLSDEGKIFRFEVKGDPASQWVKRRETFESVVFHVDYIMTGTLQDVLG